MRTTRQAGADQLFGSYPSRVDSWIVSPSETITQAPTGRASNASDSALAACADMTGPSRSRRVYGLHFGGSQRFLAARRFVERDTKQPSNVGLTTKRLFEAGGSFGNANLGCLFQSDD
jgi:hypothetical protein